MPVMNIDQSVVTSQDAMREQRLDVQLRQLEFNALLHRKLDLDLLFECLLTEGQHLIRDMISCLALPANIASDLN